MENEKKMDSFKKIKLIFLIEYLVIALVVLVIAILKLTNVMQTSQTRLLIYNIISSVGAIYFFVTFTMAMVNPKYRAKTDLLDKCLLMPLSLFLIPFNIYCFVRYGNFNELFVRYSVAAVLLYIFVIYTFLGIYHYFKPTKEILLAYEEMKKEEEEARLKALEEAKVEEKVEDVKGEE